MRVRDEIYGSEYGVTAVRWAHPNLLPRDRTATHSAVYLCAEEERRSPECGAWALNADGDEWFPVEVLS